MKRCIIAVLLVCGALLPLAAASARRTAATASTATALSAQLTLAQRDQQNLALARPDSRNLYDLTRRLKLRLPTPISPYVRATPPRHTVGDVASFWVSGATSGYFSMKATLLLITAHAYWYVQQKAGIPESKLLALVRTSAKDFESHVYPIDHAAFGQEIPLGPDRDPRITVLSANLAGLGGYYSAEDLYPRAVNPFSNQRKFLFVSIDSYPLGTSGFSSTMAHEFQHMIHWYRHQRDDTWINEGSSVLAQVLTGHTADGFDQGFASAPGTQLNNFCEPGSNDCDQNATIANYGGAFLWMYYYYQHYGGNAAIRALLATKNLSGMMAFDAALARLGSKDSARDMFAKWVIANLVDDPSIDGGIYGYRPTYGGCCIRAAITAATQRYPYARQSRVNQFATQYIALKPGGRSTIRVQFNGDPTVRIVPNTPLQGGREWWSNRGDEMDSTLTRALDLSRVRQATLNYDVWFQVERDFDYGYVEASSDNGRTWHTLPAQHTTNADPNAANYGNGYTGTSSRIAGNQQGWFHESVNLTPYAGKRILIRFEHITDDAQNGPGLTLDNVRVPAIGFYDRPGTAGWQSQGWARVSNLLPARWLVQLVLYTTHGVQVRHVPVSPDGRGAATISGLGTDVRRVVVAISPTAVQTTVPSSYTLAVK